MNSQQRRWLSLAGKWQFRQLDDAEWLPAQVPGGVHTDLLALDRMPDPFVADNEKRVQWVAESDWEYRRSFAVEADLLAEEKIFLVCGGLDTLAEVILNRTSLGKTENMFRQYQWEVKSLLQQNENKLHLIFASPVKYAAECQAERPMPAVDQLPGAPYLRKAPCHFGWDWGPKLPPIGIWKEIRLEGYSVARLADVHLRQYHETGKASIEATLSIERWQETPLTASLGVVTPSGETLETQATVDAEKQTLTVSIPQPQYWWPNGYGEQPLYTVKVILLANDQVRDERTWQMGLRTIELRREPDTWGESFTFVVNGVPIFAKGADWIPADSFPTRITDEQLEHLIQSCVGANFNMLRVWGGGFYEEERFYDLCDRYGILVWQDFIFACSIYPLHEPMFVENVCQEARENIRRLRHRASLALWNGNNEMEWGWVEWGWDTPDQQDLKQAYEQFFFHTLAELCAAEDPDTPYWPSSPSSNEPFKEPNGPEKGNTHYWEVWHGRKPFTAYRSQFPRFMSEFGFQSLPPLETIRHYADEADWNMTSYIMEHHQRSPSGNGLMIAQMTQTFRMPKDFESLVYLSMILQAEGIRYGVEHWRRHMNRVGGTLYWQLNDCWPVASWSSIDYYGRWKALHYAARRFYAPLMLSIEDDPPKMNLYLTSDLTETWSGRVDWSLERLNGEVLASGEQEVSISPLASIPVDTLDFADRVSDENRREVIFTCELWGAERQLSLNVATFAPTKHLSLGEPGLSVVARQAGSRLLFEVTASSMARFVELGLQGVDVIFSDNYFDVPAGRTVTVTTPLPEGWTLEQAQSALQVRSLYNSFAW